MKKSHVNILPPNQDTPMTANTSTTCPPNQIDYFRRIEMAKKELAECQGCQGRPCRKKIPDYFRPVITPDDVTVEPCPYAPVEKPPKPKEEIEPVGSILPSFAELEKKKWEEDVAQHFAERKPRYEAEYHLTDLTMEQYFLIDKVECELKSCQDCNEYRCRKTSKKYKKPQVVKDSEGELTIQYETCKVWIKECREQFQRSMLPRKYIDKTFADYELTPANSSSVKWAKSLSERKIKRGLFFYGGMGTGKTFLAALIAREFILQGKKVIFGDVPALLTKLKQTFDNAAVSTSSVLDSCCDCDLLILDDLGTGQVTEWSVGILYQVINDRYNAEKPVVVTSNYDLRGLSERLVVKDKYGKIIDEFSAKRITSRLKEMCVQGLLGTHDRRYDL